MGKRSRHPRYIRLRPTLQAPPLLFGARMSTSTKSRRRKARCSKPTTLDHRTILARRLDLMAGIELQHGHHHAAEYLAHQAAQLREGAR